MVLRKLVILGALWGGAALAADIPRPAPAAVFRKPDGQVIDLSHYRGKVVALECPHCQRCSRILQKMQNEFGPRGFQALGVATNDMSHMLIPEYVKNHDIRFPVGFASRDEANSFLQHPSMLIMYVPQLVFIDRKGIIRAQFGGQDEFFKDEENNVRKQIIALLADGGTAGKPAAPGAKKAAASRKSD